LEVNSGAGAFTIGGKMPSPLPAMITNNAAGLEIIEVPGNVVVKRTINAKTG
jgi:hypothetical protein